MSYRVEYTRPRWTEAERRKYVGVLHGPLPSDASASTCVLDADATMRRLFLAREADKTEDRAYSAACDRAARTEESGNTVAPRERTQWKPEVSFDAIGWGYVGECGYLDSDYVSEMREVSAEDRKFAFSAHGSYLALLRERTGEIQSEEKATKFQKQAAAMQSLSDEIAKKMASAADPAAVRALCEELAPIAAAAGDDRGPDPKAYVKYAREIAPRFNPFRADSGWELWRYYVHSRQLEKLTNYRRLRFIPYVAQSLRGPMLSALEFWLSKNPMARFWTFTSGFRVAMDGVGDRTEWLNQKLRALNKRKFMRDAGVRIVFRSVEMGTPETDDSGNVVDGGRIEHDDTGQSLFHVHAHCVVELTKGCIPADSWAKLLEKVHKFWRFRWQDDGVIRDGREVCKYVTKPGEMLKLSPDELVALEEQLSRVRLIETSGSLRAEIKARKEKDQRLVKRKTPEGRVYHVVKDWNKHVHRTRLEEAQDAAQKLTPSKARGCLKLVSRGTPRFGRNRVAEPVVTLMAMRGSWNERNVRALPLVEHVINATERKYFEGVRRRCRELVEARRPAGSGISVHTRTSTVRAKRESVIPDWAEGPPGLVFDPPERLEWVSGPISAYEN